MTMHPFVARNSGPDPKAPGAEGQCQRCDEAACMCDWELCRCGTMRKEHPSPVPTAPATPEMRKLAEEVLAYQEARRGEDIDAWAAKLAADSVRAGEKEYGTPPATSGQETPCSCRIAHPNIERHYQCACCLGNHGEPQPPASSTPHAPDCKLTRPHAGGCVTWTAIEDGGDGHVRLCAPPTAEEPREMCVCGHPKRWHTPYGTTLNCTEDCYCASYIATKLAEEPTGQEEISEEMLGEWEWDREAGAGLVRARLRRAIAAIRYMRFALSRERRENSEPLSRAPERWAREYRQEAAAHAATRAQPHHANFPMDETWNDIVEWMNLACPDRIRRGTLPNVLRKDCPGCHLDLEADAAALQPTEDDEALARRICSLGQEHGDFGQWVGKAATLIASARAASVRSAREECRVGHTADRQRVTASEAERDRMRKELEAAKSEGQKDYDGMREFQRKYINADQRAEAAERLAEDRAKEIERLKAELVAERRSARYSTIKAMEAQLARVTEALREETVSEYLRLLPWSTSTPHVITLVEANIKTFASRLRAALSPEPPSATKEDHEEEA